MNLTLQSVAEQNVTARLAAECKTFWKAADYGQLIATLSRLRQLQPADHGICLELGATHAMIYDFAAARHYFENAITIAPNKMDTLMAAAHHWRRVRNYEAAADCYRRVAALPFVPVAALLRLAEFHERCRELDRAEDYVQRALTIAPNDGATLLTHARLLRQRRQWQAAATILRTVVQTPAHAMVHPAAWDELGTILDREGQYDEAMSAFMRGKALLRESAIRAETQLRALQAQRRQLCQSLTPKLIQRWRDFGASELQPSRKLALLSGHARSGTTLLEYILDSHDDIISADETFVFANRAHLHLSRHRAPMPAILPTLDALSPRVIRQFRRDYFAGLEGYFRHPIGSKLVVDKNPVLTPDLLAFFRFLPETKFLIALRDPRDVCLSCFVQSANISPDSSSWLSLENTIANYVSIMSVWLAVRSHLPDSIEVRYEDVVNDVPGNARRVLEFLGCQWDDKVTQFHEHAQTKVVRSPTFAEVTKPVYKTAIGRWQNYAKYFEPHLAKLQPFISAFGY